MHTCAAIALLLGLTGAFWGYGSAAVGLVAPRHNSDQATIACFGIAVYIAICGLIELTRTGSRALVIGIIGIGLALAVLQGNRIGLRRRLQFTTISWALLPLLALYAAFLVNVTWWHFMQPDDTQGYLVLPFRILEAGSTGIDPFMFRRIEAGLGGNSYLYVLPLSLLDFPAVRIADLGLGSLLLAWLVACHLREAEFRGNGSLAAGLALTLIVIVFVPTINLAPDLVAIAMLYAAIREGQHLARAEDPRLREHIMFGLLIFAIAALRTNYMIPAAGVAASLYLSMIWAKPAIRTVLVGFAVLALILVCAIPWMIVVYRIAGTPYYPLLGLGTMTDAEVVGFTSLATFVKTTGRMLFCYGIVGFGLWSLFRGRRQTEPFIIFVAVSLLILGVASQTKYTVYGWRYGFVTVAVVALFFFVETIGLARGLPRLRQLQAIAVALFVFALAHHEYWHAGAINPGQLSVLLTGQTYQSYLLSKEPPDQRFPVEDVTERRAELLSSVRSLQNAVPPGELLLARLDVPFLLDFARNPIWVMDHPGLVGPPPGPPKAATVDAWKQYLRTSGVRLLAYSYANHAGEPPERDDMFIRIMGPSSFQSYLSGQTRSIQGVFATLRSTERLIYDDGVRYVAALTPTSR